MIAAALALGACASADADFAAARASWRGATYDEVVKAWGVPQQSSADSHTWLAGVPGARCDRTLAFRDGRVVDERWAGVPEFCAQFARRKP